MCCSRTMSSTRMQSTRSVATMAMVALVMGGLCVTQVSAQYDPCIIIACSDSCDESVVNGGTGETCGWDSTSNSCMSGAVSGAV